MKPTYLFMYQTSRHTSKMSCKTGFMHPNKIQNVRSKPMQQINIWLADISVICKRKKIRARNQLRQNNSNASYNEERSNRIFFLMCLAIFNQITRICQTMMIKWQQAVSSVLSSRKRQIKFNVVAKLRNFVPIFYDGYSVML